MSSDFFEAPTALIVAHPGHELLLHHFMELSRPIVFVLTDGSGGHGEDRRAYSRRVIEMAGGEVGPLFGPAPDRAWYQAVLTGDRGLFREAREAIVEACRARGVARLVADPIELFNPIHDLCAALAGAVAGDLAASAGRKIEIYDFAIEAERTGRPDDLRLRLDAEALERKLAAAAAYGPLAGEVQARAQSPALAEERLRRADPLSLWPEQPAREPYYESFGRRRLAEGAYDQLITYAGHVRPIAAALGAASVAYGEPTCVSQPSSRSATSAPTLATASGT